jgi:hypothetical protein
MAKVVANKPADVVDACRDASGNKIVEVHRRRIRSISVRYEPCNTLINRA